MARSTQGLGAQQGAAPVGLGAGVFPLAAALAAARASLL